jgi:hypothetical protein
MSGGGQQGNGYQYGQQSYGGQQQIPWAQRGGMMRGFPQAFQKMGGGTMNNPIRSPGTDYFQDPMQPPPMQWPRVSPGDDYFQDQIPQPPPPPTMYGSPGYGFDAGKNGTPMSNPMGMQAQNIAGFNPNSMQGQYRAQQQQSLAQAPDAYGLQGYMQNGQFNRGAAVNDYYGALDKLRQQGVSGQINLYDQFKGADGRYNGPMNNAMIADFSGGWQGNGQTGDLWTGKRNGKNYWLGNEVDDHQFNERFKQGI